MAEFIPQNELETLLHAGFSDPARRPAYYRAFLEGAVFIMDANPPAPEGAPAGSAAPSEHADLRIRMMPRAGGLEIGPLADPPFKLMGRMGQLFRLRPSVRAAYIFSTRNVDAGEQPHPLVGIDVEGEWDGLLREVMEIIDTHGRPREVVDVFRLDERPKSQQMRLQGTAFFQKK